MSTEGLLETGAPAFSAMYQQVGGRFVDDGWKDMVLVARRAGEGVVRFTGYTGPYLYHRHDLEHEDAGMMRSCLVRAWRGGTAAQGGRVTSAVMRPLIATVWPALRVLRRLRACRRRLRGSR